MFLDRDGTINQEIGYLSDPDGLILIPKAAEAVRRINQSGMAAVVITNQSGVARGYFNEERLASIHERLKKELDKEKAHLDGIYVCPHHPEGTVPRYTKSCSCRKPETRLIMEAAKDLFIDVSESYMVGDHFKDIELAVNAGMRSVFLFTGHGSAGWKEADEEQRALPGYAAQDLWDAVEWILKDRAGKS